MAARQNSVHHRGNELELWLHSCDICINIATNPIEATCGHLFCGSCLNEAFGLERPTACPICGGDLPEEAAPRFPFVESVASAEQTMARHNIASETAASADNNTAAGMRSSLISEARMDVVQDMLDVAREHTHTRQMDLMRHISNLRGQRIRELEQTLQNLMEMILTLLRELEDRDEDSRRLLRRIAELENPTDRAGNIALGINFVGHRRSGIRITPSAIAARHAFIDFAEEQHIPDSVESGTSTMNSEAGA